MPGLQDVTAFVDFTALAEAGVGAGFDFSGYCSQASFLIGNGLAGQLTAMQTLSEADHYQRALEVKRLTLPGEMGERFQAIGFERDVDFSPAFALGDLSHRL
jgi:SAM-dependent MidA family methyltransferase